MTRSERLQLAKDRSGLSWATIAKRSGYSESYLQRLLRGRRHNMTINVVECVSTVLDVTPAWLAGWDPIEKETSMNTYDEAQWLVEEELRSLAHPTYLIGLSGPPRSGKDSVGVELAKIIRERHPVTVCLRACSMPMRKTVYAMIGKDYTLEHYETTKDVPLPELGGQTIRQAMIALSELHVKPQYGQGFWGAAVLNTLPMESGSRVVIVTDMGFDAEVRVFEQAFGVTRCLWPQIVRPHCSFEGDSRSYVGNPDQRISIINEGESLEQVTVAAGRIYNSVLNEFQWELPVRG